MKPVDLDTRERRQLRGRAFAGVEGSDELGLAKRVALGTCGARAAPLAAMGVFVLAFAIALVISLASHAAAGPGGADACAAAFAAAELAALATQSTAPAGSPSGAGAVGGLAQSAKLLELCIMAMAAGCAFCKALAIVSAASTASTARAASSGSSGASATSLARGRLVLLASFSVFSMQSLTYAALAFDVTPKFCWQGSAGLVRIAAPLRLVYWAFSNPLIALACGEVVGAPPWLLFAAACVTAMVSLFGLGLELVPFLSGAWVVLLVLSLSCSTVVVYAAFRVLRAAARLAGSVADGSRSLVVLLSVLLLITWNAFPVIFLASQFGAISPTGEAMALPIIDGVAKVLLCEVAYSLAGIYERADALVEHEFEMLEQVEHTAATAASATRSALSSFARELRVSLQANTAASARCVLALRGDAATAAAAPASGAEVSAAKAAEALRSAEDAARSSTLIVRLIDDFLLQQGVSRDLLVDDEAGAGAGSGAGEWAGSQRAAAAAQGVDLARLNVSSYSLRDLVSDDLCAQTSSLGCAALRRGITLSVKLGRGVPTLAFGDAERLRFVLMVLLANSLIICPRGGRVEVRVTSLGWRPVPVARASPGGATRKRPAGATNEDLDRDKEHILSTLAEALSPGRATAPRFVPMPFLRFAFVDDGLGLEQGEIDSLFESEATSEAARARRAGAGAGGGRSAKVAPEAPSSSSSAPGGSSSSSSESTELHVGGSLVLSRVTAGLLGGTVGAEVEPGVGTSLFLDLPVFSSEGDLLRAVFGGVVTESARRLLPQTLAGVDRRTATLLRLSSTSSRAAAAPLVAATSARQIGSPQRSDAGAGAGGAASVPVAVHVDRGAQALNSELNDRVLRSYTDLMESRRSSVASSKEIASSLPREERELISKVILSHTNIR